MNKEVLLRTYIRALLKEEQRDRMMMGTISFTAAERADFNEDDVSLGTPDIIDDSDSLGPVPPKVDEPRLHQDPCTRDYLRWAPTTMR